LEGELTDSGPSNSILGGCGWSVAELSTRRQRRHTAMRTGAQQARYAQAALQQEAARVRAAPPGTCNHTLNRAAFNLGQLVAAGLLDVEQVREVLLAAALAAPATGHTDRQRKAKTSIASGLRGGAAKPRQRRDGTA
jgi:hypothetical protein